MYIERLPVPNNGGEPWGHIDAVDPLTGKQKWRVPLTDHPIWSANLVTGGGLLFTGKETGEFIALDIEDGKQVWQFQTGSGINAQPITYTHNGKQYITVLSGIGGLYWNVARDKLKDKVPQGGSVWTFAVLPDFAKDRIIPQMSGPGVAPAMTRLAGKALGREKPHNSRHRHVRDA
jgi:alcohol dehydrogenase (cytochrome c)